MGKRLKCSQCNRFMRKLGEGKYYCANCNRYRWIYDGDVQVLGAIEVERVEPKLFDNSTLVHELLGITANGVFILPRWEQYFSRHSHGAATLGDVFADVAFHMIVGSEANRKTKRSKEKMREREKTKTLEELFREHALWLSNSEITKVELRKSWTARIKLNIMTKMKEHKWYIVQKKGAKLEDYANMLRPVFRNRLSMNK